ncbi:molecular chaperone GrpE [Jatrophihabitans endophyticus]|uniref:Molecular chaperone GrpE n=1 Tax=Jatrophihabitans endophyticus TaxID=1206085 RepID=A0A1M5E9Q4_9ACTN|nr:hypothetical protein [Jatrophihabitans endophyticus]SHF75959.1 molecular chaperone GrpE [Jatrophihabitans endophyticus]
MSEPSLQDLADAVTDLGRVVARQGASLDRLVDDARAAAARERAGADVALLVDLAALHRDARACAETARAARDRTAFTAIATGLERLLAGRGGTLVTPSVDDAFDAATMEAAEVVATGDRRLDRTVDSVREPGLSLPATGRSVRPARVVVRRHRD